MKRALAIVTSASLMLVVGCGTQSYEYRLEKTLDQMKYRKRLDDNLIAAPTKGKLEELQIFIRPPKNLTGPTQTFQMTVVEPGRFDVESSFIEPDKQSLHLLARVKRPKTPAKKAPTPAETTPRGDFNTEVVELIKNVYGAELELPQFKEESKKGNTFKARTLDLNAKTLRIYLYGNKNNPYEVALIFEYPTAERSAVEPKIELCLESFAVGDLAKRSFSGDEGEEGGIEGGGEEAGQPVVF